MIIFHALFESLYQKNDFNDLKLLMCIDYR